MSKYKVIFEREVKKMRNRNVNLAILGIILIYLGIVSNNLSGILLTNENFYNDNETNLKKAGSWELSPFIIDDSGGGDYTWAEAVMEEWCSGDGTWSIPYIIENITIDGGGSSNGITIRDSAVYFIINNLTVYNSLLWGDRGIHLYNVNNSWLSKNTVYNNFRGIELENSNNNTLSDNTANSNEDTGIYLKNSNNNILSNNSANYISGRGRECGIILEYSNNNTVWQNTAKHNYVHGISMSNSNNNTVWNNTVRYNDQAGISLGESDYNTIELNYATKNYDLGIFLHDCYYNDILRNEVNDNYGLGMALSDSKNNTISGNTIKNNIIGIKLYDTVNENNKITDNYISDNSAYGVQLDGRVKNNLIYNNVFDGGGSTYAVDSSYDINYWDNGSIGNYWDDYTGVDADDDGIGETPYSIGGTAGAVDNYPIWDDGHNGTPILIDDTDPTRNWAWAESKTWCSGSGTYDDPYIIENVTIDAEYSGSCIEIRNSDVYFIVRNCTLYNAGVEDMDAGISVYNTFNGVITNNNCSNNINDGIYISGRNNTIDGNYVSYNIGFGISIRDDYNRIINNYIVNNLGVALLIFSDYNIIDNNTIKSNRDGMDIHACNYNNITNNIIEDSRDYHSGSNGIALFMSNNNLILKNIISRNELWGIFLSGSSNNNLIIENWISNNSGVGIRLMDNLFNIIFKNSFKMNSLHSQDDGNLNQWDNGTIGNYWDDYGGEDANNDGIGDTPYSIGGLAGHYLHICIGFVFSNS